MMIPNIMRDLVKFVFGEERRSFEVIIEDTVTFDGVAVAFKTISYFCQNKIQSQPVTFIL